MNAGAEDEYIDIIARNPEGMCVERCALICRSLLAIGREGDGLNSLGARHASAQGIRVHAALAGVDLPDGGEMHIVDWNASQGFHTLALLEALIARGSIDRVRHITFIHPSRRALARARAASKYLVGDCGINTIDKHMPGRKGLWPLSVDYMSPVVVHVLGDCLHRPGLDLPLLARLMSTPGHRHVALCVSDFTGDDGNFRQFAALFPAAEVLGSLSARLLTFTLDRHPVGCEALTFQYETEERLPFRDEDVYTSGVELPDDAPESPAWLDRWCGPGAGLRDFFCDVMRLLSPSDRLLPCPSLPPYEADFALVRPHRGILLASIIKTAAPGDADFEAQVTRLADMLRDMRRLLAKHLPGLIGRKTVRDVIRLAVIVPGAITEALPPLVLAGDVNLVATDALHTEEGNGIFRRMLPISGTYLYKEDSAARTLELLFPRWHWTVLGPQRSLDAGQEAAAAYPSAAHRVLGSPGSGKTTCLLLKAVRIWTLRHRPVLVVVPDAVALCRIRLRLHLTFAGFPAGSIHIVAYSDLVRVKVAKTENHAEVFRRQDSSAAMAAEPEGTYMRAERRLFPRYCAILVDDAHAFSTLELESLRLNWLAPGGEMCIFANPLEAAHLDLPMEDSVMLTGNYSPVAEEMAPLLARLASRLNPSLPQPPAKEETASAVTHIRVETPGFDPIAEALLKFLASCAERDMLLVADEERLLRLLQEFLEQEDEYDTMTTFTPAEAEERYRTGVRNPHGMSALHADSLRHQFDSGSPSVKLAHTSHLQGIDSRCVVYFYCRGLRPDYRAIYRTATRATRRFIIISYPKPLT